MLTIKYVYCSTKELLVYPIEKFGLYSKYIPKLNDITIGEKYRVLCVHPKCEEISIMNDSDVIISLPNYLFMDELQYEREQKIELIFTL